MERVDSNGLLPMRATDRVFPTAYAFRRFLQRALADHLPNAPCANPLAQLDLPPLRSLPAEIQRRWPPASSKLLAAGGAALGRLPIDHEVGQVDATGGPSAARNSLKWFLKRKFISPGHVTGEICPAGSGTGDVRSDIRSMGTWTHTPTKLDALAFLL